MTLCVLPTCRTHADTEPGAHTCQPCRMHLVRQLADIEDYLAIISPVPGRSGMNGPIGRQFESRPPLRLDIVTMFDPRTEVNGSSGLVYPDGDDDVLDELPNIDADLGGWVRIVAEEAPEHLLPDFRRVNMPGIRGLVACAAFLRSRCDWICKQLWADEIATDIARVHGALRRACKDDPSKPAGTCLDQACADDVYRRSDDPTDPRLQCSRCRTTYDGLDLARIRYGGVNVPASLVVQLLAREAAAKNRPELAVTVAALWQWRRRGHIGPGPGYDVAEILAYLDRRGALDAQVRAVS